VRLPKRTTDSKTCHHALQQVQHREKWDIRTGGNPGLHAELQMVSMAKRLGAVTKWMIKAGMLEQFSRAAEILNEEEQEGDEDGP
jgi:hypothetical protein